MKIFVGICLLIAVLTALWFIWRIQRNNNRRGRSRSPQAPAAQQILEYSPIKKKFDWSWLNRIKNPLSHIAESPLSLSSVINIAVAATLVALAILLCVDLSLPSKVLSPLTPILVKIGLIVLAIILLLAPFVWWIVRLCPKDQPQKSTLHQGESALGNKSAKDEKKATPNETKSAEAKSSETSGWKAFGLTILIVAIILCITLTLAHRDSQPRAQQQAALPPGAIHYKVLTTPEPIPPLPTSPSPVIHESVEKETAEPTPPPIPPPTPGVMLPQLISKVEPSYTEEALRAHFSGRVFVDIIIDEDGYPTNPEIIDSPGFALDKKIIAAVEQWRFQPATKDGVPVRVHARITTQFQHR